VNNTASDPYSLKAMTVVVLIFLPLVLAYQTWTYYVFRRRVSRDDFIQPPPVALAQTAEPPGTAPDTPAPGTPAPTVVPPGRGQA
jgi:cytochrome d ubiquinol oxidase subunit II